MKPNVENEVLYELISAVCDGRPDDAQIEKLSKLLRTDAKARDEYLRYVDMHAALADETVPRVASNLLDRPCEPTALAAGIFTPASRNLRPAPSVPVWTLALAACVFFMGGFWGWQYWHDGADRIAEHSPPALQPSEHLTNVGAAIATVLLADNCDWGSSGSPVEGQRLGLQALDLKSGLAVIRFDGGAELVMTGATSLVLRSAGSAELLLGDVVVRAEAGAEGFELQTPARRLIDLGTEFSASVDRSGATELHVLDGEVEYAEGKSLEILSAGNAIRFESPQSTAQQVKLKSRGFDEIIQEVNPKSQPDKMFAYEGFFYDEGELPLEESTRGKGWVGPWRKRTNAEGAEGEPATGHGDTLQIVHGQMNVTWPVPGGRLGMLQFPPGKSFLVREMLHPIDLGRDGIYYFSLMVRESEFSLRLPQTRPRESMRLTFRSAEAYFGEALSFQISAGRNPQIQTGLGVGFASAAESSPDQTTLWIGKIIARKDGEDEVSFRVFAESDELTYAEPAVWHVVSRNLDLSAKFNLVLLTSTGAAPRIVDELRIGPTWRSVTPMLER